MVVPYSNPLTFHFPLYGQRNKECYTAEANEQIGGSFKAGRE